MTSHPGHHTQSVGPSHNGLDTAEGGATDTVWLLSLVLSEALKTRSFVTRTPFPFERAIERLVPSGERVSIIQPHPRIYRPAGWRGRIGDRHRQVARKKRGGRCKICAVTGVPKSVTTSPVRHPTRNANTKLLVMGSCMICLPH